MKGISPQSISRTYLIVKALPSKNVILQRASVQHSIAARKPTDMGKNFGQVHSRGYRNPSFVAPEPKGTSKSSDASTKNDNSDITTRNHAYYQRYSICGFHPTVCTPVCTPPQPTKGLSKEDKKAKKTGHNQEEIQANRTSDKQEEIYTKKTGHEHTCPIHSYSRAYYQQFSIDGFYHIDDSPTDSKPTKKPSTVEPKDDTKKDHVCSITTCNHAYFRTFSISGFYPAPTSTPTNPASSKPTCIAPKISMAEAPALAAAFTPSTCFHQKTNDQMEHLNLEHDIDTFAQTIEELGFETLGITGFQGVRDDMEGGKGMMEYNENNKEAVKSRKGGPGPVRAGLSGSWLFLFPF
ncbi:uncharacterized protein EAF01_009173 [Botrytis porri]|uniref:Uncharacterized protein n=1 Tax=Botrytis porri TaxID=87229 RepID=A0A4Z1KMQ6_9HELO|nr:uncharacterized protein EAF01_009173 [Botrytis porri]KAF7896770.1 hypothetical protein EAF01_009173 [Botrytis porri]TGO87367.1 hypothetical protein BPOR_0231g00100 [Botrytis porri]